MMNIGASPQVTFQGQRARRWAPSVLAPLAAAATLALGACSPGGNRVDSFEPSSEAASTTTTPPTPEELQAAQVIFDKWNTVEARSVTPMEFAEAYFRVLPENLNIEATGDDETLAVEYTGDDNTLSYREGFALFVAQGDNPQDVIPFTIGVDAVRGEDGEPLPYLLYLISYDRDTGDAVEIVQWNKASNRVIVIGPDGGHVPISGDGSPFFQRFQDLLRDS